MTRVLVLLALAGCPAPRTVAPSDPAVAADTERACARTRSAGAWSQLIYQSATWRDLAERADRRDARAWDAIAELIAARRAQAPDSACTAEIEREVRASAARLTPAGS